MISTTEEIAKVGTISASGAREIGDLIARAMDKVGKEGVITLSDQCSHLIVAEDVGSEALVTLIELAPVKGKPRAPEFNHKITRKTIRMDGWSTQLKQAHENIIESGVDVNPYVAVTFLIVYLKCGGLLEARRVLLLGRRVLLLGTQ